MKAMTPSVWREKCEREFARQKLKRHRPVEDLARETGISNIDAHNQLFDEIMIASLYGSTTSLAANNWRLPKDYIDWKSTRAQFQKLVRASDALENQLASILENPTAALALSNADHRERLPELAACAHELKLILAAAASIEGRSGNRPHADWKYDAASKCQQFWAHHMNSSSAPYFDPIKKPKNSAKPESDSTFGNAFTEWFCSIMKLAGNITPQECVTLMKKRIQSVPK